MHVRRHAMKDLPTSDDGLEEVRTFTAVCVAANTMNTVTLPRQGAGGLVDWEYTCAVLLYGHCSTVFS